MDATEHYIQDACELLAVARLQELAEQAGRASSADSKEKYAAFTSYLASSGVQRNELDAKCRGYFDTYVANLEVHLPNFINRLFARFPGETFDFVNVETEARNAGRKEDFIITRSQGDPLSFSLKNYRQSALTPQVTSGTFNSFLANFLFESGGGPGKVKHPVTGKPFQASAKAARDEAAVAGGYSSIVPMMHELDALNDGIKKFVTSPEFEYYDDKVNEIIDLERKRVGLEGARIASTALGELADEIVRARVLTLAGLDVGDELLLMDPKRSADTLSNRAFGRMRAVASDADTFVTREVSGQQINFAIHNPRYGDEEMLKLKVPFTINKNGAWNLPRSGSYEGTRPTKDVNQIVPLAYGQRKPKKSKQIATSVNTYVQYGAAGIFRQDEV